MGTAKARLMVIDSPPRHGKSEYISKHLTAWHMAQYPDLNVVLTSYEAGFATSWGAAARDVLERPIEPDNPRSPPIATLFGPHARVDPQRRHKSDWSLVGHEGRMRSMGAGGAITGKGAHLMVIDDPIKNAEEAQSPTIRRNLRDWFQSTVATRLEPQGCLILMATRWHRDDPSGYLLQNARSLEGEPVLHVHMPAIAKHHDWLGREEGQALWPERWPLKKLHATRRTVSTYWWQAMYQGTPTAHTSAEWPDHYFGPHIWLNDDQWPTLDKYQVRVLSLDPSKGKECKAGDYRAIVSVGIVDDLIYVDASLERQPSGLIVRDMISWAERWRPHHVGIESNAFQELLAMQFEQESAGTFLVTYPVWQINNMVNKIIRIRRLDPYLRNHQFRFRYNSPGCHLLVEQLRDFPLGEYDDGPDALEMAIRLIIETASHANPI